MQDAPSPTSPQRESAELLKQRGDLLRQAGRPLEALHSYDQALTLWPDFAEALKNRGNALRMLGQAEAALASYRQALSVQPEFVEALNNCGVLLQELDRPDAALDCYQQALRLRPEAAATLTNCGVTLQTLGRPEEALACYQQALQLQPDAAAAHVGASLCYLLLGDFTRGWQEYEWRWRTGQYAAWPRAGRQPLWLGQSSLAGRTILLHAEQGLGDTLQFCRYAGILAELGATVLLEVPASLQALLAQLPDVAGVYAGGAALPPFDCHCPLMSLPLALRTQLATIPAGQPYLHADPLKVAAWAARLEPQRRPLIGLAWSGSPTHVDDRHRSLPLAQLGAWFSDEIRARYGFVMLQNEVRAADRAALAEFGIIDVAAQLHDFTDTAALLACVERVITVDTAVAHLAGALGRPTTLMLPYRPDSRWLLGRADSPWYPSLRLLRQTVRGTWDGAIAQVAAELAGGGT